MGKKKNYLRLLESSEGHLGLGDVFLWVLKVVKEGLVSPDNTGVLVGGGVGVANNGSGLTAEDTVQIRPSLVGAAVWKERKKMKEKRKKEWNG